MDAIVTSLDCGGRRLVLDRPRICGIINITPDSFSDGGRWLEPARAIEHGVQLAEAGADLLDVGAESTRPGADPVSAEQENARLLPVVEGLARAVGIPLSVDTSKPEVMRAAIGAGAGMINDVRALREPDALETAAELGVPVCLMHMLGEPRTMQDDPSYADVVAEVHRFLAERVFACELAGIPRRQVLVDPGFGFGKTLEHNLVLLANLRRFDNLGNGLMVGLSRKSMIARLTGQQDMAQRVAGSAAAALLAAQRGARILRVHDVSETRDVLTVWQAVQAYRPVAAPAAKGTVSGWDEDD